MLLLAEGTGSSGSWFVYYPYGFGLALVLVCGYLVWRLLRNSNRVRREILLAKAQLSKYDRNAAATEFATIHQWFIDNTRVLRHPWIEFRESCVELKVESGGVQMCNTIDAAHFFQADELVDGILETEVTRHVPGFFTALGIVGTFLGIWLGLDKARTMLGSAPTAVSSAPAAGTPVASSSPVVGAEAADKVTQATQELLNHVGPAFGASFFAVCLAVLFLLLERLCVQTVRAELSELQVLLDKLFPRKTAEGVLIELLAESGKQSVSVQKISTDFAPQMETVLQTLVDRQAQKIDEANQALIANIAVAIHSRLEPLTESLAKATSELKADQSKSATEAIESLVGRFSSTLTSGAETQVTQLSGTIQSLVSALEVQGTQMVEQQRQMEDYLARVGSASQGQAHILEQQVQNLVQQAQGQQDESTKRLEALFERLTAGLTEQAGKASQESTSALSKAGQDLSAMVEEAVRAQQVAAGTLQATLGQMQESITRQMTLLAQEVTQASQSSSASVSETQDRAAERIALVMQATQQSIEDNLQRLAQTMQSQSSRHQEESLRLLVSTLEALRKATEDLVVQLRAETSGHLAEATASLRQAASESQQSMTSSTSQGLGRVATAVEEAMGRLGSRMDALVASTTRVNEALLQRFDGQATLLDRLTKQTSQQMGAATADLEAVANRVAGLLDGLATFAEGMKTQILAQREVSGQLSEVSRGLQAAAQSVKSQSATAQGATALLETLSQKLVAQNAAADERIRTLRDLHQQMVNLAAALTQGVERQHKTVDEMNRGFDRMKESANNYFGSVVPSLQKALGEFDKQLTKGTDMLGAAVQQMADPCENIADILEGLQKRLGRN